MASGIVLFLRLAVHCLLLKMELKWLIFVGSCSTTLAMAGAKDIRSKQRPFLVPQWVSFCGVLQLRSFSLGDFLAQGSAALRTGDT